MIAILRVKKKIRFESDYKQVIAIGQYRVRSLMREQGLEAIVAKKYKQRTTDSKGTNPSLNLLKDIKLEQCAVSKVIIGETLPTFFCKTGLDAIWRCGKIK